MMKVQTVEHARALSDEKGLYYGWSAISPGWFLGSRDELLEIGVHTPVAPSIESVENQKIAQLESLITMGLDPDHIELMRQWPLESLRSFALNMGRIIEKHSQNHGKEP